MPEHKSFEEQIWTDGTLYYHGTCIDLDEDDVEFHATEIAPEGTECDACGKPFPAE